MHISQRRSDETIPDSCDVLVIGGGPAGAAVATLLAEAGLSVVIVEKEHHPRFHIGESLLPHSLPILERLGVLDRVREQGVYKAGAEFISEDGSKEVCFEFRRAFTGTPPHAYQVRRAEFDKTLFDRAREAGAVAIEDTTADVISCEPGSAVIETCSAETGETRRIQAGYLVDATGRSTLTARMMGVRNRDPRNSSAAVFGHFSGVPRADGERAGNIRIYLISQGWVWQIPLLNGVTSVGVVTPGNMLAARKGSIEDFFYARCHEHPEIKKQLEGAECIEPLKATGNFSYRSVATYGPGFIRVGDAFAFIDPIFSTGVHIALYSAASAAAAILECRRRPRARDRIMREYDRDIRRRLDYVAWFIYRIHDRHFRDMLLNPRNILGIERAVVALLAGDLGGGARVRWRIWLFKTFYHLIRLRNAQKEIVYE